jgi:hypothetical protein
MDLKQYLSLHVEFDFVDGPRLVLTDVSAYPIGANVTKRWFLAVQPDGVPQEVGDETTLQPLQVSVPLHLDAGGDYLPGTYNVGLFVIDGGNLSPLTFTVPIDYQKLQSRNLVEDFNLFKPELVYRDETDYKRPGFATVGGVVNSNTWRAVVGEGGAIGELNASNTALFDLAIGGRYYSANYYIEQTAIVSYQHATLPYLTVKQKYTSEIWTSAFQPLTVPQMFDALKRLHQASLKAICGCETEFGTYSKALDLYSHVAALLNAGSTTGVNDLVLQFLRLVDEPAPITNKALIAQIGGKGDCVPPADLAYVVGTTPGAPVDGESIFIIPNSEGWYINLTVNKIPQAPIAWGGAWFEKSKQGRFLVLHGFTFATDDLVEIKFYGKTGCDGAAYGGSGFPIYITSADFDNATDYTSEKLVGQNLIIFVNEVNQFLVPGKGFLPTATGIKMLTGSGATIQDFNATANQYTLVIYKIA